VNNLAAELMERHYFGCLFLGVIPASEARRESVLGRGEQPIPDKPTVGRTEPPE